MFQQTPERLKGQLTYKEIQAQWCAKRLLTDRLLTIPEFPANNY